MTPTVIKAGAVVAGKISNRVDEWQNNSTHVTRNYDSQRCVSAKDPNVVYVIVPDSPSAYYYQDKHPTRDDKNLFKCDENLLSLLPRG